MPVALFADATAPGNGACANGTYNIGQESAPSEVSRTSTDNAKNLASDGRNQRKPEK